MRNPIQFMGRPSGNLWWDVKTPNGWLVVKAGRFRRGRSGRLLRVPKAYWSPNGTPWHHGARSVFRARYVEREECVCDDCKGARRA